MISYPLVSLSAARLSSSSWEANLFLSIPACSIASFISFSRLWACGQSIKQSISESLQAFSQSAIIRLSIQELSRQLPHLLNNKFHPIISLSRIHLSSTVNQTIHKSIIFWACSIASFIQPLMSLRHSPSIKINNLLLKQSLSPACSIASFILSGTGRQPINQPNNPATIRACSTASSFHCFWA